MMSITSTAGTPLCSPPVSRGGRHGGRCAVRAQAAEDGGAVDSSEQKSMEIMRKFSEQYDRRSSTFFCSDKSVTTVVIKL
uniref:Ferredoxin-thioredoxin reductase catalytic chain, chloroplastic n=1 Tax=Hordeum vulgare subsp. vulgare TaxID=112509 RepID=A0A8I6Y6J4_HORVV